MNRERTFWIYKHNLFHRDRPEDLHLLRRRTCPGVDGRKNRFVAVGTRKSDTEDVASQQSSRAATSSDDSDRSSDDETSQRKSQRQKKRRAVASSRVVSKRVRKVDDEVVTSEDEENSIQLSVERKEISPEQSEILEQSLVVSQVAMKLEEYAKKAKKGSSLLQNSRTRGGVVTPPTGSAVGYLPSGSTSGLITYDDETFDDDYHSDGDDKCSPLKRRVSRESVSGTDCEDTFSIEQEEVSLFGSIVSNASSPVRSGESPVDFESPPISELETVNDIVQKILASSQGEHDEHAPAFAAVIGFCMTTAPVSGDELFSKVFDLIYSSDKLAEEFHKYRAALHPLERSSDFLPSFMFSSSSSRENRVVSVQQTWARNAGKSDAVHEFKTFAVNYFHKVLLHTSGKVALTESQVDALRYTADVWLQSARAGS